MIWSVFDIGFLNGTRNQKRVRIHISEEERFCTMKSSRFMLIYISRVYWWVFSWINQLDLGGKCVWCTLQAFSTRRRMAWIFQLDNNFSKLYTPISYLGQRLSRTMRGACIARQHFLKQSTTTWENKVWSVFDIGLKRNSEPEPSSVYGSLDKNKCPAMIWSLIIQIDLCCAFW